MIKTAADSNYKIYNEESEIVFDRMEYNRSEKRTNFFLYNDLERFVWKTSALLYRQIRNLSRVVISIMLYLQFLKK